MDIGLGGMSADAQGERRLHDCRPHSGPGDRQLVIDDQLLVVGPGTDLDQVAVAGNVDRPLDRGVTAHAEVAGAVVLVDDQPLGRLPHRFERARACPRLGS